MKKLISIVLLFVLTVALSLSLSAFPANACYAASASPKYFTVYKNDKKSEVLLYKGDDVNVGDKYLSHDNDLYEITDVDEKNKTAIAKFLQHETLPEYNVIPKSSEDATQASSSVKVVGLYHTHNDESYYTPDGTDSVYGEGGIHDVGAALSENFNKLGIETIYRTDLHLPHNSGAYTRSQVTASAILEEGVDAIFDIHRDSTSRDYYLTKVNGEEMSSIRMVIGAASANYEENKNFAYSIKAYADEAYPGLIKDIYVGSGNYNQQLSTRAMLFEMGCENIEKDLVIASTEYLAKTMDVVLYGSEGASELSLGDVSLSDENSVLVGLANSSTSGSNTTLWILLGIIGGVLVILSLVLIFSKKARYKVGRFFSEMFAGIFGKKKKA